MVRIAEICCGSLEDAIIAEKAGADRIELTNATFLYGLTPSIGTVKSVVEQCKVPVVVIARPRPGGFYYNEYEFNTMLADIEAMVKYDIEGVLFGCLDADGNIDIEKNKELVETIHKHHKDAVFHRAFDCVKDPYKSIELLIELGVKRVLTCGLKPRALDGLDLLIDLEEKYGKEIDIIVGDGIMNHEDFQYFIDHTNITQYHDVCTGWRKDPTTIGNVSYSFASPPHHEDYNLIDYKKAIKFVNTIKGTLEDRK